MGGLTVQGLLAGNDVSDSDQDELPPLPALVAVFSDSTLPGLREGGGKDASEMTEGWSVGALRCVCLQFVLPAIRMQH